MAKHYIRLDSNLSIIKGFSSELEEPDTTDICINEDGGRQFELNGEINPPLVNLGGCHLYKYHNGEVNETTEEERAAELDSFPKVVETDPVAEYMIDLDFRLSMIELGV
jgi:hypothetical protein